MEDGAIHFSESLFNSHLSFRPLVHALKKNIREGGPGMQKLYGQVVEQFEKYPELMSTIHDHSLLFKHAELIEELLSSVFPPTSAIVIHGVSLPFKYQTVYASPLFRTLLLKPGTNEISIPQGEVGDSLNREKLHFAYGLILKKIPGL